MRSARDGEMGGVLKGGVAFRACTRVDEEDKHTPPCVHCCCLAGLSPASKCILHQFGYQFMELLEPNGEQCVAGIHVQVHDPRSLPAEVNKGKSVVLPYQDPDRMITSQGSLIDI